MGVFGQGSWRWAIVLSAAAGAGGFGCAHTSARPSSQPVALAAGNYAVESIRSRTSLGGREELIEISESGTRMVDPSGDEHVLTERGALLLAAEGSCRLALAVSVDGEEPGVSDQPCTWSIEGDRFFLGDGKGELRTLYRVQRMGERLVLDGLVDVAPDGKVLGDAAGERIVLVEGPSRPGKKPVERRAGGSVATRGFRPSDI
ncbi:MAG: hypothetical protein NVS2B9_14190 [Myxococcales bacterium]